VRVVVLGAAAGGGLPQWNCACPLCRRARAGDPAVPARTQASLAVSVDGDRWLLINASPDIRQQLAATRALHPPAGPVRGSPIAAVVLTNADVDHVAGLLSLRERQPFVLLAAERVLAVLAANPIFAVLDPAVVERRPLPLDATVAVAGLDLTAFAVPGKVALWLEAAVDDLAGAAGDTIGLEVRDPGRGAGFFYVPACRAVTPALARRLDGAALVFFDGTTWTDDEMPAAGAGAKTAARMGHVPISGADGSIARLAPLAIGRRVFIHLNNTNPVVDAGSPERRRAEAAGWEIAEDGMEIRL
jgi:pyrroloquinoline quinone biosynthesis protein B